MPPPTPREWPWVDARPCGFLELSFDAPLNKDDRVDWLKVRDWLTKEFGARFTAAEEYPTFEWHARFFLVVPGGEAEILLAWSDFPDELVLRSTSRSGDAILFGVAERLRELRPELGTLKAMSGSEWRDWMVSLGADDYR